MTEERGGRGRARTRKGVWKCDWVSSNRKISSGVVEVLSPSPRSVRLVEVGRGMARPTQLAGQDD